MNLTKSMIINTRTHWFHPNLNEKSHYSPQVPERLKNTLNGIPVWVAMQAEKDNDGNRDMKIQRLFAKSHRKFGRDYPGGLLQHRHDIETVYEELNEFNVERCGVLL